MLRVRRGLTTVEHARGGWSYARGMSTATRSVAALVVGGALGALAACSSAAGASRTAAQTPGAPGFDLEHCEHVSCAETGSCDAPIRTPAVCLPAAKAPESAPAGASPEVRWVSPFVVELSPKRCASYAGFWCEPDRCDTPEPKLDDCADHRGIIVED